MKKILLLLLCLSAFLCQEARAQDDYTRRHLTHDEVKQLSYFRDSVTTRLKKLYQAEKRENAPGKYQPERIELVRQYLWLFQYVEQQAQVVDFTTKDISSILGKADSSYNEAGYFVMQYSGINRPYLRIRNMEYSLVFRNSILVHIKKRTAG